MHGDDVHETREINGLCIRDSDYRARPIWIYSGHLLNLRKSNPLLLPYTFEKTISMVMMLIKPSNKNSENHCS